MPPPPLGCEGGTVARAAPHATIARSGGGRCEASEPQAARPYEEAAQAAPSLSHRQAQPLRARVAAPPTESAPRPSPPLAWGASPPSGRARP
eukprot:scaffold15380_cov117-Isochrysis_galbana.AAC.7